MAEVESIFVSMYAAFNRRDIEGVVVHMREGVDWPAASEGGRVVGKDAIRAYWMRQWAEFDPRVEPVEVVEREGRTEVRVRQLVRDLKGEVLSDQEVWHRYALVEGLVARMDVVESAPSFGRTG